MFSVPKAVCSGSISPLDSTANLGFVSVQQGSSSASAPTSRGSPLTRTTCSTPRTASLARCVTLDRLQTEFYNVPQLFGQAAPSDNLLGGAIHITAVLNKIRCSSRMARGCVTLSTTGLLHPYLLKPTQEEDLWERMQRAQPPARVCLHTGAFVFHYKVCGLIQRRSPAFFMRKPSDSE